MKPTTLTCLFLMCLACGGDTANTTFDARSASSSGCAAGESLTLALVTDDGVDLIADLYPSVSPSGDPAVILVHMIPPSNSKDNFPVEFAQTLQGRGFTVLNLNRRGAPGSGGSPGDAYNGPNGKLDIKAAYDYLQSECNMGSYSLIGASNGTTTVVDFAVHASENSDIQAPVSIVALSGGSYTENQNPIASNLNLLPAAALFAYPASESTWNDGIEAIAANWQFIEYEPGAHGTGLITTNPEITETLLTFLELL